MNIKPIRTERDLRHTLDEISTLLKSREGTPEADRLEVLSTLVAAYEAKHHPIPPPTAVGALLFELDQGTLTKKDLERALGGSSKVAEVLSGKRELSRSMIWNLHSMFSIPLASLVHPPRRRTRAKPRPRQARQSPVARHAQR